MNQFAVSELHDAPAPSGEREPETGVLAVMAPLFRAGLARLDAGLAAMIDASPQILPSSPRKLKEMLTGNIRGLLERMLARTLALEVNVSRLLGTLHGSTPGERYNDFLDQLRQPSRIQALFEEYPVLFQLATARTDDWVNASLEAVGRLCADWEAIRTAFPGGLQARGLARVDRMARYTRRGGRSVLVFTFDSGFKIVYKPRSLAAERHFQDLLYC